MLILLLTMISNSVMARKITTYYHSDMYGSPTVSTTATGKIKWKEQYKPYGERYNKTSLNDNDNLSFTGYSEDNDTGLSYAGARWYNPVLGRFTGIDPVGINPLNYLTLNRYAYANNNPYRYVDPDGRAPQAIKGDSAGFFLNGGLFTVYSPSNPGGKTYGTAADAQSGLSYLAEKAEWGARIGETFAFSRFSFAPEFSSTGDFGGSLNYGFVGLNVRANLYNMSISRVRGTVGIGALEVGLEFDEIGTAAYLTNSTPIPLKGTTSLGAGPTFKSYLYVNEGADAIEGSPTFVGPVKP